MTPTYFLRYLQQPDLLADLPLETVRGWVDRYPYAANLRLLLLLRGRLDEDPQFETYLADYAATTFDRAHLFQMLEELRLREQERDDVLELRELDELELAPIVEEGFEEIPSRINRVVPEAVEDPFEPEVPPVVVDRLPRTSVSEIDPDVVPDGWLRTAVSLLGALPRTDPTESVDDPPLPPAIRPQDPAYFERQRPADSAAELRMRLRRLRQRREPAPPPVSTFDRGEIASETLAELLVRQRQYPRAIRMYRRLILLYPEKKAIFAGLIHELKEKL